MADESGDLRGPAERSDGLGTARGPTEHGAAVDEAAEHVTADGTTAGHGSAASAAITRLAALRRDAAAAYATISAADTALHALARQRVAGERVLRGALARQQAASRALAAHARAKPGRLAQLLTGFRAGREWLTRQADLNAALREASEPLTAARRTVSGVKREFAAQVRTRAEAGAALRRLTADCVTVLEEIGLADTGLADTGLADTEFGETAFEDAGLRETGLRETGLRETGLEEFGRGADGPANTPAGD
jgi:hypothetical protein